MARKGIPRGVSAYRAHYWFTPFRVGSDEYNRVAWTFGIPFLGYVDYFRPKLCWDCMSADYMNAYFGARFDNYGPRRVIALGRLYSMWDLGIRATEKR